MPRKSNSSRTGNSAKELRTKVLQYISQQKNNTFNYKQVAFAIDADTSAAHRNIALILA